MKKLFFSILFAGLLLQVSYSQENCNPFFTLTEGTEWIMEETFKGKVIYQHLYTVKKVEYSGGLQKITIEKDLLNKKGKSLRLKEELIYTCINGEISLGYEIGKAKRKKDEVIELKIPSKLKIGQKLNDGKRYLKMYTNGAGGMRILTDLEIIIKDRIVESKEEITIPLGTFEAYKITANRVTKNRKSNSEGETVPITEYLVEGMGFVMQGQSVMISFTPPE